MHACQELHARFQVEDLLSRYTWAIDDQNWAAISDLVTDDVVADYRQLAGEGALLHGIEPMRDWLKNTLGWRKESLPWHFIGNHLIEVDGHVAHSKHYVHNRHMTVWGTYLMQSRREQDGWRMSKLTLKAVLRHEPLPDAPVGPPKD